jgi:hypothetical protein
VRVLRACAKSTLWRARRKKVRYSRQLAVVYYLTKDWHERLGGSFVDLATGSELVPRFNSLVAFWVPRMHEVTPMRTRRERLSVFGWFYVRCSRGSAESSEEPRRKQGRKHGREEAVEAEASKKSKRSKRCKKKRRAKATVPVA